MPSVFIGQMAPKSGYTRVLWNETMYIKPRLGEGE